MINETVYNAILQNITDPKDGCIAAMQQCRDAGRASDPQFWANNQTVNDFCAVATELCFPILLITSEFANRNVFDIAQIGPQSLNYQHINFFNKRWVQQSLGVPVNFTDNANLTTTYFLGDGDAFRQNQTGIEYLLDNDIQVALVYGDRDSRCNWIGVENVSLTVDYPDASNFRSAGYADIETNSSYKGGVVRQYDGFSFSRVFEAGHSVSTYQPETVSRIFERVMFRQDVATGKVPAGDGKATWFPSLSRFNSKQAKSVPHYKSKGPSSSWAIKNVLPPSPKSVCNLWAASITCTDEQLAAISNGTAETHDFLVTSPSP